MLATIIKNCMSEEDKVFFNKNNPNHSVTNDCIKLSGNDRYGMEWCETLPIFKMKVGKKGYTPYGMARNTGKYIVCARYDRYYKFDLEGNIVSLDSEDDNTEN